MKEGYRLLGDFIRQVDVRNTDGKEENLLGVSVQKMFIPSIANTVGTDFTKYKVVKRGQFTYIPDTSRRGDKIGIALLTDYDEGLVSNIYTVFEVKDENELLPEYLMLWFSRPEFDRYARFKSHGSVREIMDWDEMCKVELPVPSIDKQRSIVKAYQTITERIELKRRINDNLEATALSIYKCFFVDYIPFDGSQPSSWKEVTVDDIASDVICGKTPPTADPQNYGGTIPFITIPDMHGSVYTTSTARFLSEKGASTQPGKMLPANSVCVSCIASVGLVCLTAEPSQTNQQINSIICKEQISPFYVYTKMTTLNEYLKQLGAGGSTTLNINKTLFGQIPILLPDEASMKEYHNKVESLFSSIRETQYEIQHLESLKRLLLSQLSSR